MGEGSAAPGEVAAVVLATAMRGSSVKKACPMLNEAEGSRWAEPVPGVQASVALGARKVLHRSKESAEFINSAFFNSMVSGRRTA